MRRALVALVVLGAVRALGEAPAAPAEQLREIEARRAKLEGYLKRVNDREQAVLDVLDDIEKDIKAAKDEAAAARASADDAARRVGEAKKHEGGIEAERARSAREAAPRLLLRYRLRSASYLGAMIASSSIGDFLWTRRMVDRVLRGDFAVLQRMEGVQRDLRHARENTEGERLRLLDAEQEALRKAEATKARRADQAEIMRAIAKEKGIYERAYAEVERARNGLMEALGRLPTTPEGLGGFSSRRGQIIIPAAGKIEVQFGKQVDRRTHTTVQQKGLDIRAPQGALVRCPHAASVGFAGWFKGFGNLIVLDHGEGYYTLYAHLDEMAVAKGARVNEGDTLGTVGETGSLKGPYLYFEIRSGSKALNPKDWLKK